MRHSSFFSIRSLLVAALVTVSSWAQASLTVYTDRASFESALGSVTVDNLDDIAQSVHASYARPNYTIDTVGGSSMYGCWTTGDCGDNTSVGFTFRYLWDYQGVETFSFTNAVTGFGFDYANPVCCSTATTPSINGIQASANHGFFGVISDLALNQFSVDQVGVYMIIDNVTYGSGNVPEPGSLALVGLAMLGLIRATTRKRA